MSSIAPVDPAHAVLLAVSELLGREVALDDVLQTIIDRIRPVMNADRCTLYLLDRNKGELFSKVAHLTELPEIRLKVGQGVAGHVAATGEVVNVPTTNSDERFYRGVDAKTGYHTQSILAAPLRDRAGMLIGVVQLLNKVDGPFTHEDEQALAQLANQAAMAIEATTLYGELCQSTVTAPPLSVTDRFNRIVGESEPMRAVCRLTAKAAASTATVLIRGESGTGKELFARAVHVNSPRRNGPFVKVDCAALPSSLIENELFGHERGAYTSADQRTVGKFDLAQGGTLFLDELGELPLGVQGKLLRVLQDREFERVGGSRTVHADVRVVAATNRDLERLVEEKAFRADLYYRIKVVEIVLPPLRDRGADDIIRLARHFVALAAKRHGSPVPQLAQATLDQLVSYSWPGNVRELENCLESAVIIMDGNVLLPKHLPLPSRRTASSTLLPALADVPATPPGAASPVVTLAEVEKSHILRVLTLAGGNQTEASRLLGIGRNTLLRKLHEYGVK